MSLAGEGGLIEICFFVIPSIGKALVVMVPLGLEVVPFMGVIVIIITTIFIIIVRYGTLGFALFFFFLFFFNLRNFLGWGLSIIWVPMFLFLLFLPGRLYPEV